ncbi:hypothetical protein D3C84_989650 [compost metagenome]
MRTVLVNDRALFADFGDDTEIELLQIAQSPVNELGRAAGRAGSKILHVDNCRSHAARLRVKRDSGAGNTAAYDEQIERLLPQAVEQRGPV